MDLHDCMARVVFFFNDTATTEIYTLSLHDALPIWTRPFPPKPSSDWKDQSRSSRSDRKSTRLNSSHLGISYAVFCLKKKTNHHHPDRPSTPLNSSHLGISYVVF